MAEVRKLGEGVRRGHTHTTVVQTGSISSAHVFQQGADPGAWEACLDVHCSNAQHGTRFQLLIAPVGIAVSGKCLSCHS